MPHPIVRLANTDYAFPRVGDSAAILTSHVPEPRGEEPSANMEPSGQAVRTPRAVEADIMTVHVDLAGQPVLSGGWHVNLPKPRDQHFWWAETELIAQPRGTFTAYFDDRTGSPTFSGRASAPGDGRWASFGMIARFGLSAERRPSRGLYLSVPHFVADGVMSVQTLEGHWYEKDSMAFGGVTFGQRLFQTDGDPALESGRSPRGSASVVDPDWKLSYKNSRSPGLFSFPGFRAFPPLPIDFATLDRRDLWAEVTVRFDVRVRYGGVVEITPWATIDVPQWKANPA